MSTWRRMGGSLQRLGLAIVAVAVLGLVAGWLFARGTPQRAAGVVLQYRADQLGAGAVGQLERIATDQPEAVMLAPNPDLARAVVATSWQRRLALPGVNRELLGAFVTAYAGARSDDGPCDAGQ